MAVYMGGGPSPMYAAEAVHAFEEFNVSGGLISRTGNASIAFLPPFGERVGVRGYIHAPPRLRLTLGRVLRAPRKEGFVVPREALAREAHAQHDQLAARDHAEQLAFVSHQVEGVLGQSGALRARLL